MSVSALVVATIVGVVLGVTLGNKKNLSPVRTATATSPPTPSPTAQDAIVLLSLVESTSFDDSAALLDHGRFSTLQGVGMVGKNENFEEYTDWQRIQCYILAVFF